MQGRRDGCKGRYLDPQRATRGQSAPTNFTQTEVTRKEIACQAPEIVALEHLKALTLPTQKHYLTDCHYTENSVR